MKELEDMRNDELFTTVVIGIQILRDNARKQGYADGKADTPFTDTEEAEKKAYERGLNDAWECARKMCLMSPEERLRTFDVSGNHLAILSDLEATKALEKIKAYEERQKQKCCHTCKYNDNDDKDNLCDYYKECLTDDIKDGVYGFAYSKYEPKQTDEIKVGDEVIVQVDRIGFVTGFDVLFDRVYVTTKDGWSDAFGRSFVKKTGRHFDAIPEVLKQMNREEDK